MKKFLGVFVLLMFVLVTIVACGSSSNSNNAEVATAIDEAFNEYGASLIAGDADSWIALWTDDPMQLIPDAPAATDRESLYEGLKADLGVLAITEMDISVEEVQVAGDWAYARGNYMAMIEMKDGSDQIPVDGKFLTIFQQQSDGSWKIHRDIYNSNVP